MSGRYMTLSTHGLYLFMEAIDLGSLTADVVNEFDQEFSFYEFDEVLSECSDILYGPSKGCHTYEDDRVVRAISDAWSMVDEADRFAGRVKSVNLVEITSDITDEVRSKNGDIRYYLYDFVDGPMTFTYQRAQLLSDAYQLSIMAETLSDLGKPD